MLARLGIAPIAWSNDDLPELGGDTPLKTCLSEARAAGFAGVETGGKFPRTVSELQAVLADHQLELVSGWYPGTVLDASLEQEKDRALAQLALFRELNAACLVYGETAGSIQTDRNRPLDARRRLATSEFRDYGRRLTEFAEFCAEQGVPLAFHHHMATAVETPRDIEMLMNHTGEAVHLLLDPGHLVFAGGDPLTVIQDFGHRILHVHAKDVRRDVLKDIHPERHSFLDAVLAGVFTVPGDGSLDFAGIARSLADVGYEGWFVVEAEQDPALAPPARYAAIGFAEMSRSLRAAGYRIDDF